MTSTNDIRSTFLEYFAERGHQILPSASLVPQNDPSLLFTNAGMVPFKNIFTGQETTPYKRATTAQKVVRAGGKHNDLDNVGYTARHHTFFEMMGNFSFGDYFKAEVIEFAWNLLTKGFGISKEKLLVTVYSDDDEAAELWKKIAGFSDDKIIRISTSDNFWRMGDTGPCGPSSEIFYDHGPDVAGGPPGSPEEDGDRFVEIWNLVFMQFFEEAGSKRSALPRPSIDTGMGLERFAAIMQGKRDNYDTDTIRALIEASADLLHQDADGHFKMSHRVVADHLRSTAFLISDGVLPSREGRGYVLRRIMRRAMRHLHMMGAKEPVFYRLLPALIQQMGHAYPELVRHQALITETMRGEEERFAALLTRGLSLLDSEMTQLSDQGTLPGELAFKLYDTFGFPLDLTQDVLRERGHKVDEAGFEAAMAEQRQRARAAWVGSGDSAVETVWFDARDRFGATEFFGYVTEQADAEVQAIFKGSDELAEATEGQEVALLLNQSPFYGESGGQVGDHGTLTAEGLEIAVTDTQKKNGDLIVHYGRVVKGTVKSGMTVRATVDHERRTAVRAHHSATHLLHEALRRQVGEHVTQKGSLNAPDRLRFDISQPRPLTAEELRAVEEDVNARIRENSAVTTRLMTPDQARAEGAMALFGEKYGDEVRVVAMGEGDENRSAYSIELCGGTHVERLGEIGLFRIISEAGVASGVRRIEAVCGRSAEQTIAATEKQLHEMADLLKVSPAEAPQRLANLLEERKALNAQIASLQHKLVIGGGESANETINGITLATRMLDDVNPRDLKGLAETLIKKIDSGVVALISGANDRGSIIIAVTKDLSERLNAVDLVRSASPLMGGKGGGGRPTMAQAGGARPAEDEVFSMLREHIAQL
ncbi:MULTISPECIES: alanine--tRNA ligase [unclassified Saccharibacter]|uniref:alanine--tRNA ligase n=1 Tax=unclassified Saccharibacter TaxID=2648722 RepID=UPI001324AD4A|nr:MULTISPECIES: alanine--tRNA ligase [unclassified Saccharibacter]MXV36115.1 alanine--tRNA ligase [Saccharibacter sp. EH611]MXV56974.1 alanine--tRNA ligase [Saccharibacter sp. EH70]MXV66666.1 alanine--tRNA ligase [Saccharibacter sp. EH60]